MKNLIRSLSGIRGIVGETMTPLEAYKTTLAFYNEYLKRTLNIKGNSRKIIIGKDPKNSGERLLAGTAAALRDISRKEGCNIQPIYLGVTSAPILQWVVKKYKAIGGINFTASHNPIEWNGMKLVTCAPHHATLLDGAQMAKVNVRLEELDRKINCEEKNKIQKKAKYTVAKNTIKEYNKDVINKVTDVIDRCSSTKGKGKQILNEIKRKKFKVVIDACSKSGAQIPKSFLLALGLPDKNIFVINNKSIENSKRPLEPTPPHLTGLKKAIKKYKADVGFAFDPDQDRLVTMPLESEECTPLVAHKFLLQLQKEHKVKYIKKIAVNLSTSSAWEDIAGEYHIKIVRTPVGEVNVAFGMLKNKTILGAEGNGGVILGTVNYGRNSTVGMILTLCYLAWSGKCLRELESQIPGHYLIKTKVKVSNPEDKIERVRRYYRNSHIDNQDGYKIFLRNGSWMQIRASNTEPVVRIFVETKIKGKKTAALEKVNSIIKHTELLMEKR
jgi:phosphomannomutase